MSEQVHPPPESGIPAEDWAQTPTSVQGAFIAMYQQIRALREEVAHLREQMARNSRNSSQPPSSDGLGTPAVRQKPKGGKQGGQKGHTGHGRDLLPIEQVDEVVSHQPAVCTGCGAVLEGEDRQPYRYQVTELPPVKPHVTEHQVHRLTCRRCGAQNRGELPPEVAASQFGPNLVAWVAILMGVYRLSKRQVAQLLVDSFGVDLATGSVIRQQVAVSEALTGPVEEACQYVQAQAVRNVDETGWPQEERSKRGWLWVVVTPWVTVFRVALSRAGAVVRELVGSDSCGVVGSDRFSAYNWLPLGRRQVCWAHLIRDFQKMLERGGQSALVGEPLHLLGEQILKLWGRVRDGTLAREECLIRLPAFQQTVHHFLTEGRGCSHPRTAQTCRNILAVEAALWTFASHAGVEPTNNSAERALRKAVIWRGISHGTHSETGSRFVERILSVVETCRQQERNPLDYIRQAIVAHRLGQPVPSLLPAVQVVSCTP